MTEKSNLSSSLTLAEIDTPSLILSIDKFDLNVARMRSAISRHNVRFRPHLKTAKSLDVAVRLFNGGRGPITVSTLKEAEEFAGAGFTDIFYAVSMAPSKLARVVKLIDLGIDLSILIDSTEQAEAVAEYARVHGYVIPTLIEIDCDGHRSGVAPADKALLQRIANILSGGTGLRGVATHCGQSYWAGSVTEIQALAAAERAAAVTAAENLRALGHAVPVVSVGSTPTALHAQHWNGVTEVRAGVFMFGDLVQVGARSCTISEIAVSVLATVIGKNAVSGHYIIDAGWMALSRDRGTAMQKIDQKYGVVCDLAGNPIQDVLVLDANQEHGMVGLRDGSLQQKPEFAIGSRIRILPNHACASSAQHGCYHLTKQGSTLVTDIWPRFSGW